MISVFINVELIYLLTAIYILTNAIEDSFIQMVRALYSSGICWGLGNVSEAPSWKHLCPQGVSIQVEETDK